MIFEQITHIQFAVDAAMATLIWMVQLVIYPVFRDVVPERFHDWHLKYMKTISRIVIPLMFIQALCHGLLLVLQPSFLQWMASTAILAAWIVTFMLSVPCHQALQRSGHQIEIINRLIRTNWLRTLFWTLTLLLGTV
ncbi:hypothetical protein [Pontiella sulfatireligans]|uniref:DUF4149 domain-containing protein n=1 Tax=Pontiella sulfatireligans TaxID=2750658 RepID=A0A6C2UPF1_9BACT|nr:hypothetical protein [Pontiella sulfatireligans]VGO22078.1 hypothetical protein SCARR_04159 [Pontiella sulfatireligans]